MGTKFYISICINWPRCIQCCVLVALSLSQKIALPTWPPFCHVSLQLKTLAIHVCDLIIGAGGAGADRFSLEEA